MNSLSQNLKALMASAKISSHELAKRIGTKQTLVHRLMSGDNDNPKLSTLYPIAKYFSVSISQLIGEKDLIDNNEKTDLEQQQNYSSVPIVNKTEIGKNVDWLKNITARIIIDGKVSEKSFGLKVTDQNMAPVIPIDSIVIVEPDLEPENKDFVIVKNKFNEFYIQYYIAKENDKFLLPCLTDFDKIELFTTLSDNRIIGTVVKVIYGRKR